MTWECCQTMLALISPAKKQDFTTTADNTPHSAPLFTDHSMELMGTLRRLDIGDLMGLMKISQKLAELNVDRYELFSQQHTTSNAKQAALAFLGDTYVGLDATSFTNDDWEFASNHLGILSGLYGFLRPLDLIQPHRLEMGTRLPTGRGNNLYEFWCDTPTNHINATTRSHPAAWIINLASQEYFKVVRQKQLQAKLLTPIFKENRAGQLKVIGIKAKRARGMMARFIIKNRLLDPEPLKDFNQDGYQYRDDLSSATEWVFVNA